MKENMGYLIRDTFGCFPWRLGLSVKEDGKELCWDYVANRNATSWHGNKNLAIAQIKKLEELNAIAQIPGLAWELVYANPKDYYNKTEADISLLTQDIPKRCKGKHRKAVKEICKKYKVIFQEIVQQYRDENDGGGAPIN